MKLLWFVAYCLWVLVASLIVILILTPLLLFYKLGIALAKFSDATVEMLSDITTFIQDRC